MKHTKRILTLIICIVAIGALCSSVFAGETVGGTMSSDTLKPGDTVTFTVSVNEIVASSLGVSVSYDDSLEVTNGEWLKTGLIASYDHSKDKGAFTPGGAAKISGDIFRLTLKAIKASDVKQSVRITVIAKNGATKVLEEEVIGAVDIACASHFFGDYEKNAVNHSHSCLSCGYAESGEHKWNDGVITDTSTCKTMGKKVFACTVCGYEKTESIPVLAHTAKIVDQKEATCKEAGYSGDEICAVCNEVLKKGNEIAKLAHTAKIVDKKEATCKETGYSGDEICTVCNEVLKKGDVIAVLTHQYSNGKCIICGVEDLNDPIAPETTVPETTVPETTVPETTVPETYPKTEESTVNTPVSTPIAEDSTTSDTVFPETGVSIKPVICAGILMIVTILLIGSLFKRKGR